MLPGLSAAAAAAESALAVLRLLSRRLGSMMVARGARPGGWGWLEMGTSIFKLVVSATRTLGTVTQMIRPQCQ